MSDGQRTPQLERIRSQLTQLQARGDSVPNHPISEVDLAAFESRAGVRIPGEFRDFVETFGVGGEGPGNGLMGIDAWGEAILERSENLFALECPLDPTLGYGDYPDVEDPAQGAIAIASDGAGAPYTLLVVSGRNRGRIARYDPDSESCVWVERAWPVEPLGFLDYYESWVALRLAGGVTTFYGSGLIGNEADLLQAVRDPALPDGQRARASFGLSVLLDLSSEARSSLRDDYEGLPPTVRAAMVSLVAGRSPDERLTWEDLLRDPSADVRRMMIRHLRTQPAPEALAAIARSVDDVDDAVAEGALIAIAQTPHLTLSVLERSFERSPLRVFVVSNLARFPSTEALTLLVRALGDPSVDVRRVAAFSLGSSHFAPDALASLALALDRERDPTVRNAIERSVRKLSSPR